MENQKKFGDLKIGDTIFVFVAGNLILHEAIVTKLEYSITDKSKLRFTLKRTPKFKDGIKEEFTRYVTLDSSLNVEEYLESKETINKINVVVSTSIEEIQEFLLKRLENINPYQESSENS